MRSPAHLEQIESGLRAVLDDVAHAVAPRGEGGKDEIVLSVNPVRIADRISR